MVNGKSVLTIRTRALTLEIGAASIPRGNIAGIEYQRSREARSVNLFRAAAPVRGSVADSIIRGRGLQTWIWTVRQPNLQGVPS